MSRSSATTLGFGRDAIHALPGDPDKIAAVLTRFHVYGMQQTSQRCPIAVLLYRVSDALWAVSSDYAHLLAMGVDVPVPNAVGLFVEQFDKGAYPWLRRDRPTDGPDKLALYRSKERQMIEALRDTPEVVICMTSLIAIMDRRRTVNYEQPTGYVAHD